MMEARIDRSMFPASRIDELRPTATRTPPLRSPNRCGSIPVRRSVGVAAARDGKPHRAPVAGDDAARLIIAVGMHHGSAQAAKFAGAVLAAVWVQERNIADTQTLSELLSENQLDSACLELSRNADVQKQYEANTQEAIDIGVFGSPTYVIDGELFWGQDRLEFVSRKLLGK